MEKSKSTRFYVGSPVTNVVLVKLSKPIQGEKGAIIYEFRQRPFAHEVAYFDTKEDAEFAVKNQTKEDETVLVVGYYEQVIPS